ncbi:MAG: hypothetical protein KC620_24015, partial [Myxococcales bacterium]|nr:hypothetical protein [Myxococcales bacterium]
MTRRLLVNGLFAALLAAPTTGGAAPPRSDVERLREGLPAGFQRPLVVIYPLVDQRLLVDAKPGSAAAEVTAPSWEAFLDGLRGARNLALQMPARTRRAITEDAAYRRALELALATANRGYQDYR